MGDDEVEPGLAASDNIKVPFAAVGFAGTDCHMHWAFDPALSGWPRSERQLACRSPLARLPVRRLPSSLRAAERLD
jgi:hypothetical protein